MTENVGSISYGTHRPQDLIPRFLDALNGLDPDRCREIWNPEVRDAEDSGLPPEDDDWWSSQDAADLLSELFGALEDHAPPYCYFGAKEGDGADFGFWPDIASAAEDLNVVPDPAFLYELDTQQALVVNEHGNTTLYERDQAGEWQEIWSVV
ncbi:MAG TPA: hypothetical protein VKA48_10525 [Gammaproteobacteria bacterium]|nr:hypothetical protein [Gammaproteobacteria bacterium]